MTSSNFFYDAAGNGYQHRTAWAGAGDGVLVLDLDDNDQITQRNQIVFTEWDPTAKDDMEALRNVFDTNANGKLDSGDAQWSTFKIMVTNADGTMSLQTLAEAGIQSIDLTPNAAQTVLPDGSRIDGETTFTRADNTTGTAAAVTLSYDPNGYAISQTVTPNPDGSTTIRNIARRADGTIASETSSTTSADGLTITGTYDADGDGVVDQTQTSITVVNPDGSKTETLSKFTGAGVLFERTVTTTSADRQMITIGRDLDGDGTNEQTEVRNFYPDGSRSIVISNFSPNGSLISKTTTTTSADGRTRTVSSDVDGDTQADLEQTNATVVAAGVRTETVTEETQDGSLRSKTITETSADGRTKTTTVDSDGDTLIDTNRVAAIVVNANGSTTTTTTDRNRDTSLRGKSVVEISANGLLKSTQVDVTGDGVFDLKTTEVTVVSGGNRTVTTAHYSANDTLLDRTVDQRGADGRSRTIQTDKDGDNDIDRYEAVAVAADGSSVHTISNFNPDGSLKDKQVTATTADGLTETTQFDVNGDGVVDSTRTTVTLKNVQGGGTVTQSDYNGDGSLRGRTITTASANGLSTTVQTDVTGDGAPDMSTDDVTVVNVDGSRVQTLTHRNANGTVHDRTVTEISADRKTISITRDFDGDGVVDQTEISVTQANGTRVATISDFNRDGLLRRKTVTTQGANGLSATSDSDLDGDGDFDTTISDETVLNANGSRVQTIETKNANGLLRDKAVTTVNATGLSTTREVDRDGDGAFDLTTTQVTALNANGSQSETVTRTSANSVVIDKVVTTIDATGLSSTVQSDLDGDAVIDRTLSDVTTLNANGSRTQIVESRNAVDSSLRSRSVATTSADGRTTTVDQDTNGDGALDLTRLIATSANGSVSDAITNLNSDGSVRDSIATVVSADGRTRTVTQDLNGDGVVDLTNVDASVLNADGTTTQTITTHAGTALTSRTTVMTSADGRSITTSHDYDGNGTTDCTKTDVLVVNADGSRGDLTMERNANNSLRSKVVTSTSADRNSVTITSDINGDAVNDRTETTVLQSDGSRISAVSTFNPNGSLLDRWITTTSANGLSTTRQLDTNGDGAIDETLTDAAVLDSDGGRTRTTIDRTGTSGTIKYQGVVTISDDGLRTDAEIAGTNGQDDLGRTEEVITALNANGSATTTSSVYAPGGALKDRRIVTTSANGLEKTVQLQVDGNVTVDRTETTIVALDGSRTDTVTRLNPTSGALQQKDVLSVSFDARTRSLQRDTEGDGVDDHFASFVTNADGSTTETIWNTTAGGVTKEKVSKTISDDAFTTTVQIDEDGDGDGDFSVVRQVTINADGARTETVLRIGGNGVLWDKTSTTSSANGLSNTTQFDANGDGTTDSTLSETVVYNADGTRVRTAIDTYADGTFRGRVVTTTSPDGSTITRQIDDGNNGTFDRTWSEVTKADGSKSEVRSYFKPDGSLEYRQTTNTSFDGRTTTVERSSGIIETKTLVADSSGSYSWTQTGSGGTSLAYSAHTIDANGIDTWTWNQNPAVNANATVRIDVATEARFVDIATRLYDTVLDRDVYTAERELLARYIADYSLNTTQLISDLLSSAEFAQKYGDLSNAQFVQRVYQNALGRGASVGELAEWLSGLSNQTISRADLVNEVSESAEHQIYGNGHVITRNFTPDEALGDLPYVLDTVTDKNETDNVIRRLCDSALDRDGTTSELSTWGDQLRLGTTTERQIAESLLASAEFATKFGTLTNAQFFATIAQNTLHRRPTVAESQTWTEALDNEWISRADLVTAFAQSIDHLDVGNVHAQFSAVTYTLPSNVANLILTGTDAVNGTGNSLDNLVVGNSAGNVLSGSTGNDTLDGGAGADTMIGGSGNDTYVVDNAGDVVTENADEGTDTVQASISYVLGANVENLTLTGSSAIDGTGNALDNFLTGNSANNTLTGGTGNDTYVVDNAGDVVVEGAGEGIDTVKSSLSYMLGANVENLTLTGSSAVDGTGNALDNILLGNSGNNTLAGGQGNDTYGVDNIGDVVVENANEGTDTVRSSITYTLGATLENLTLMGSAAINGTGNALSNVLTGNDADNILSGGAGADTMSGGMGNDTYVVDDAGDVIVETYSPPTGWVLKGTADVDLDGDIDALIENTSTNALQFEILQDGVSTATHVMPSFGWVFLGLFNYNGDAYKDLLYTYPPQPGLQYVWTLTGVDYQGQTQIQVHGGYTPDPVLPLNGTDSVQASISYTLGAGVENLTLTGSSNLSGTGNTADNLITGNSGDNNLSGLGGNDTLDGGAGNDALRGGTGNDTYKFGIGSGQDTIDNSDGGTDRIVLGTGISAAQLTFERVGDDLRIIIAGASDTLTVQNWFLGSAYQISEVVLADNSTVPMQILLQGTTGNDALTATNTPTWLVGLAGDDTLNGGTGGDALIGATGADLLKGSAGNDSYTFNRGDGADTVYDDYHYTESVWVTSGYWTNIPYQGDVWVDTSHWESYDVHSDGGADTLEFGPGISASDIVITMSGNDLIVGVKDPNNPGAAFAQLTDKITLQAWADPLDRIETFRFADGSSLGLSGIIGRFGTDGNDTLAWTETAATIAGGEGNDTITGGSFNDTFSGDAGDDTLNGGGGNDTLDGGTGSDILRGGAGNDSYLFGIGSGTDTIDASGGGLDRIVLGSGIAAADLTFARVGNDLRMTIAGINDTLTVQNWFLGTSYQVSAVVLADNSAVPVQLPLQGTAGNDALTATNDPTWLLGLAGDDTLTGGTGGDALIGGLGSDLLQGGAGNDSYFFNRGDGADTVYEATSSGSGGMDVLTFGSGIKVSDISIAVSGNDLIVGVRDPANPNATFAQLTDKITLQNWTNAQDRIETFQFEDGIVLGVAGIIGRIGTDANDAVTWTETGVAIDGGAGDDTFTTGSYNDSLVGGVGNDTLTAGGGDDTLSGGVGNDLLRGGAGNDTYVFGLGSGADTIDNSGGGLDRVLLGTEISASDVTFTLVGNNLLVTITGASDTLTIQNWNLAASNQVSAFIFADGSSVSPLKLLQGTSGNDTLTATNDPTWIMGFAGNDTLNGGTSGDALIGGTSADLLKGSAGNDTYMFDRGDGSDTVYDDYRYTESVWVSSGYWSSDPYQGNVWVDTSHWESYEAHGDGGADALSFGANISVSDIVVVMSGNDLIVGVRNPANPTATFAQLTDKITLQVWKDPLDRIEKFQFADGTVWNVQDIISHIGTDGDDVVSWTETAATVNGGTGSDSIAAGAYNDVLTGGDGNDSLAGGGGDDSLDGGAGDDTLDGGSGTDTATYQRASAAVQVSLATTAAQNTLGAGTDALSNIENLTGTGFADTLTGSGGANILKGLDGNDTLDGGAGADMMYGGVGDDVYVVDSSSDSVIEYAGEGTDHVQSSATFTLQPYLEYLTLTGAAAINGTGNARDNAIIGNSANNSLYGLSGNDTLDGGAGADTLYGGFGDDTYTVDNAGDVVSENTAEGTDLVLASLTYTLANHVENLTLTGSEAINGTGNALDNVITGNSGNNILIGFAGADVLDGGAGADSADYTASGAAVTVDLTLGTASGGDAAGDTLVSIDNLTGSAFSDVLIGNAGDNVLNGGSGNDTLVGGLCNDTYVVDSAADIVSENPGEGVDTVQSSVSYTLGADVENLTLIASSAVNGTGNALANVIIGNSNANILDGSSGADTMAGGAGNDGYVVDDVGDVVMENTGEGTDTVQSWVSYMLGANVENLTLMGAASIGGTGNTLDNGIVGNSGNNVLDGGAGNDTLDGGAGDDTLRGGAGNDTYVFGLGTDTIDNSDGGTGTVVFAAGITAAVVTFTRVGDDLRIVIDGTSDNLTVLNHFLGASYEIGSFLLSNGTPVPIQLALVGTAGNDALVGTAAIDVIKGLGGDDTLDGSAGADTLIGGSGNDTYVVDNAGDVVTEAAGEGTDLVQSSVTYSLSAEIENLTLTGAGAINGTGNALGNVVTGNAANNTLIGGAGDDVLHGWSGTDTLIGGTGNDTYVVDDATDVVTENAGEGMDTVQASFGYVLGSNVENLILTGTAAINGTGNSLDNAIIGNSGNNLLVGGVGADTLGGGAGSDTLKGEAGNDTYVFNRGDGIDTVYDDYRYTESVWVSSGYYTSVPYQGDVWVDTSHWESYEVHPDGGSDTLSFGPGISVSDVTIAVSGNDLIVGLKDPNNPNATFAQLTDKITLQSWIDPLDRIETLRLGSVDRRLAVGTASNDTITGAAGNDWIFGLSGNDALQGGSGNDVLDGGEGNDSLTGGAGNDIYVFGLTGGQDQIINGDVANSGPSGELQFAAGVAADQVWFQHSGNDLIAILMGSQDRITIAGWYSSNYSQLSAIKTSSSQQVDSGLEQLVQAMATYAAQNPGFDATALSTAPNDPTLQGAIAAAWH